MASFEFRYASLLRHRRNVEEQRQRELAQLVRTRMILQGQLRQMQETIRQSKQDMTDGLVGRVDVDRIGLFAGFSQQVIQRGQQIVLRLAQLEKQISEARRLMLDALRQRKALDRLQEKHHEKWQRELDRRETQEADEMAAQRYLRRQAGSRDSADAIEVV